MDTLPPSATVAPPSKRPRPMVSVDDRVLANPVSFTAVPARPRMYMLPLKKRIEVTALPGGGVAAGKETTTTAAASSAASAPDAGTSGGAGVGAVSSGAGATVATREVPVCIPLVRPPLLQHLDDYLSLVGNMFYQVPELGKSTAAYSMIRRTTLGRLTSPIREPTVLDRWSPYEIALFESGICVTGKIFPQLASIIRSKSTKEVIEFYYVWKKGKNYVQWKATFRHPLPDAE